MIKSSAGIQDTFFRNDGRPVENSESPLREMPSWASGGSALPDVPEISLPNIPGGLDLDFDVDERVNDLLEQGPKAIERLERILTPPSTTPPALVLPSWPPQIQLLPSTPTTPFSQPERLTPARPLNGDVTADDIEEAAEAIASRLEAERDEVLLGDARPRTNSSGDELLAALESDAALVRDRSIDSDVEPERVGKRIDSSERKPVSLDLDADVVPQPGVPDRYVLQQLTRITVTHSLESFGADAPRLGRPEEAVVVATGEDNEGRIDNDKGRARYTGLIDRYLDDGRPVLIGVSGRAGGDALDGVTDHHVLITGRGYDAEGRLYYDVIDPKADDQKGRFFVDESRGNLFQPRGPGRAHFEMTRVHVYR
ncbi:MAG: hypothetical protein AAFZ38_11515 [Myxococcota bacterium]